MSKNSITSCILSIPQTECDVSEWETINYLCECLFCDFCGQQVRHSSSEYALMICVENIAHATAVQMLGGRNSGPSEIFHHVDCYEKNFPASSVCNAAIVGCKKEER